ncbi:MAG: prepilin peptidase [Acidobacteria bacterium]|nr:prepilin peptidase [Acidobacteriota bacterium]
MTPTLVFVFGLCLGSFLNVCIHRLPRGRSIVHPRSRCPRCFHSIAAYDNIPLLSYLLLGGRCRHCRGRISAVYPLVELLTGVVLLLAYRQFGLSAPGLKAALLALALIVLTFTDLHYRRLPDAVTFPGIAAGFAFALWVPVGDGTAALALGGLGLGLPAPRALSVLDALLGALLGAGLLFLLGEIFSWLMRVEGLGLGDVKLMAMVGLFLGFKLTWLTLFLGSLVGVAVGGLYIWLRKKKRRYRLPFGTYLSLAALVALFWGEPLVAAYLSLSQ